jgi:hypothetical protein
LLCVLQGKHSSATRCQQRSCVDALDKHNSREPQRRRLDAAIYSAVDPLLTISALQLLHFSFDAQPTCGSRSGRGVA